METEATDVFGSEIGGDDDPFAGTEFGDFEQPAAEPEPEPRPVPEAVAPPAADIPIVDKEGAPVIPPTPPSAAPSEPTGPTTQSEAPVPSSAPPVGPGTSAEPVPAPAAPPATAQAATAPPATKTPPPGIAPEAQAAMDALKKPQSAAPAVSPDGSTDSGAPNSPAPPTAVLPTSPTEPDEPDPTAAVERPLAPQPATPEADAGSSNAGTSIPAASAGPTEPVVPEPIRPPLEGDALAAAVAPPVQPDESPADGDGIESPEELKDKKGRVTHRRYLILQPDGSGKYTEVHWHVDKDGRMVAAGTKGAKKQKHALSRGQEDALKIGYAACGAPPRITLIAVAESQFQPKTIEPEAPRPERARLKIR